MHSAASDRIPYLWLKQDEDLSSHLTKNSRRRWFQSSQAAQLYHRQHGHFSFLISLSSALELSPPFLVLSALGSATMSQFTAVKGGGGCAVAPCMKLFSFWFFFIIKERKMPSMNSHSPHSLPFFLFDQSPQLVESSGRAE